MLFRTGDRVVLTLGQRTVDATVLLASENGRSLMLGFEAIVEGCVGMMPVFDDGSGTFHNIMTGTPVQLAAQ